MDEDRTDRRDPGDRTRRTHHPEPVAAVGITGVDRAPVVEAFADAGLGVTEADEPGPLLTGPSTDGPELLCAVGTDALRALARRRPSVPLLVVDGPRGSLDVPRQRVDDAARALADGDWERRDRPLLTATHGELAATALLDVTLLAGATGISEYAVQTVREPAAVDVADADTGDDRREGEAVVPVSRFRADGVTVATATGSQGYAHDAGGPALGPGVGAASVVPVGPFTIDRDRWVLGLPLAISVEREETAVSLIVDGTAVGEVRPGEPVRIARAGTLALAAVPARRSHFRRADRLEKT